MSFAEKASFDVHSANIVHTKVDVWDHYSQKNSTIARIPFSTYLESSAQLLQNFPFLWRMLQDVWSIPSCWYLFIIYGALTLATSLLPGVSLWYSGQLLRVVSSAAEKSSVDTELLITVAAGRFLSKVAGDVAGIVLQQAEQRLNRRIQRFYHIQGFHAMARLDVPTFEDSSVRRQLETTYAGQDSTAWTTIRNIAAAGGLVVQAVSQVAVLVNVMKDTPDGRYMAAFSLMSLIFMWTKTGNSLIGGRYSSIWAATTNNDDYIRSEGLKKVVSTSTHRQEIVAGNMWPYLFHAYRRCIQRLQDSGWSYYQAVRHRDIIQYKLISIGMDILSELPQILFTLRAIQNPSSIPVSLASLDLVTKTTNNFNWMLVSLVREGGSISRNLADVRQLYAVDQIANHVVDGTIPFPEDESKLQAGLCIEFKNVSFKYPDSPAYALHDVSFKLEMGQLCVIVGENGSGKSTILKLVARIYDPLEGDIFVNGSNIRSLRLEDLRRTLCVLFQDYTHFPLSIKENIGLGDPKNADDEDQIRQAAKLGGAEELIEELPDSYDSYLDRPVSDIYSNLPEGTKTLFGKPVSFSGIRRRGRMSTRAASTLSGGQLQRIALSRMFMRSLVSDQTVGLLLFDEPSASLDPTAEHDLFERLRQLRGNKTMIFSSHRFGNLTRHADQIIYIHKAKVVEIGTHGDLLRKGGEYARIWNLQAQQFL